jgi:dihydrofolate reductase
MRKLVIQMQVTLDGFVGAPDGDVNWAFPDFSDDAVQWIVDHISEVDAHLMGRSLYHDMAGHWPTSTEPYAPAMNDIPKIVFSSTLKTADWKGTTILSGDLATEVGKLKDQAGKELLVHGGARLAQSLTRAGLVDEYRLLIHPVVLGEGLRLFDFGQPTRLKPVSTTTFTSGLVAAVFHPG